MNSGDLDPPSAILEPEAEAGIPDLGQTNTRKILQPLNRRTVKLNGPGGGTVREGSHVRAASRPVIKLSPFAALMKSRGAMSSIVLGEVVK
jgi:hypothetical protein